MTLNHSVNINSLPWYMVKRHAETCIVLHVTIDVYYFVARNIGSVTWNATVAEAVNKIEDLTYVIINEYITK